jgi:rhamnosyltransferase
MSLAATIILYHPSTSIISNINSYINNISSLYIIDNSEQKDDELLNQIKGLSPKCQLLINPGNYGVAKALNQAVEFASRDGHEWLLTMDQDSIFHDDSYFKAFKENIEIDDVAIFIPQIIFNESEIEPDKEIVFKAYDDAILTSGSILNIKTCLSLGGFETKLFIDEVDTDYYFKVLKHKLKIVIIEGTYLIHALGKERITHLPFHKTIRIFEHQPFRHYYITRNYFYLVSQHFRELPHLVLKRGRKVFLVKLMHAVLFHPKRFAVIGYTFKGFFDFVFNRYGILK